MHALRHPTTIDHIQNMTRYLLSACAIAVVVSPASAQAPRSTSVADWRADVEFLHNELISHHPKLYYGEPRHRFDVAVARLEAGLPNMSREQIIMGIARALATIQDGHTQINPANDQAIGFHRYPIRLYWYSDGLFVRATAPEYRRFAGSRLLDVDGIRVDTIVKRLWPYIHGDNEMTVRDVLPSRLVLAEVLHTVGGATSSAQARFRFQLPDGTMESVILSAVPVSAPMNGWVTARDVATAAPRYLRNASRNYWFEYIDSLNAVYAQINAVSNSDDETLEDFCSRLFSATESRGASSLVLDIRLNNGGNNTLNKPCVLGLIRETRVNQPGKLFVIIGRLTFSAAMNLAVDIERNTNTTFVGEPTGASPNHFGETRKIVLPRSGITVLHSTLYWQSSDPRDARPWIDPAVHAVLSSADYRANRDPAMDSIVALIRRRSVATHAAR